MKHILRDTYLVIVSFICGVLLIVSCGGGGGSIAAALSKALDISFDTSDSTLSSKTVQGALQELDQRFPIVQDANGKILGFFFGTNQAIFNVFDSNLNAIVPLDPITGKFVYDSFNVSLAFQSTDCSGEAYMLMTGRGEDSLSIVKAGSHFYGPDWDGDMIRYDGITSPFSSKMETDGSCTHNGNLAARAFATIDVEDTLSAIYVKAKEVDVPTAEGPLTLVH